MPKIKMTAKRWRGEHHSAPGEPPFVQLGHLRRSITWSSANKLTRLVGSSLKPDGVLPNGKPSGDGKHSYAWYLEYGCFLTKSVLILTKRGWTNLGNIKVGDFVLTHKNNWRKVLKVLCFNADKKNDLGYSYNIKTEKGFCINVTGNHPVMTDKGWVRADKLETGVKAQIVYNDLPAFHWKNFQEVNPCKGRKIAERSNVTCDQCGKVFEKRTSRIHRLNFCSMGCSCAHRMGKNNPHYGMKHPNMHSSIFRGKMSKRMRGKKNPMFDKKRHFYYSDIGFRDDIKLRVRSTWEANIIRILIFKKLLFEYEPESFKIDATRTWTPDLRIKCGKKKYYIEIKGYMDDRSRKKILLFRKLYGGHLLVIGPQSYQKLMAKYKDLIPEWEDGSSSIRGKNLKFEYDKIVSITKWHAGKRPCFNLSVEEDESFIANHIVTHNTSKMAARPYLLPALRRLRGQLFRIIATGS